MSAVSITRCMIAGAAELLTVAAHQLCDFNAAKACHGTQGLTAVESTLGWVLAVHLHSNGRIVLIANSLLLLALQRSALHQ